MSTAPKKPSTGTKPAIKPAGGMLNDRRIRQLLAIIGAIIAWMAVTIVVQPGTTKYHLQCPGGFHL